MIRLQLNVWKAKKLKFRFLFDDWILLTTKKLKVASGNSGTLLNWKYVGVHFAHMSMKCEIFPWILVLCNNLNAGISRFVSRSHRYVEMWVVCVKWTRLLCFLFINVSNNYWQIQNQINGGTTHVYYIHLYTCIWDKWVHDTCLQ